MYTDPDWGKREGLFPVALRTPLWDWHRQRQARLMEFGGWEMPIVYSSIQEEHRATRRAAGLFDICHMGRITLAGAQVRETLEPLVSHRVADLRPGQVRYNLVLNDAAGTLDDVLVYCLPEPFAGRDWLVVVNASNREKILNWFRERGAAGMKFEDRTPEWGMLAFQGPAAIRVASKLWGEDLATLENYHSRVYRYEERPILVSRTGYTGEDGIEAILPSELVLSLAERLLELGREAGAVPVGLGARDTLRLEAGMPLYGHELSESIDPIQARLGWAVKKDGDFIGRAALAARPPDRPVRVGLALADKRIAREGFAVQDEDRVIGHVASGTFGPTLERSIAMAYVEPAAAAVGKECAVEVRQSRVPARVVPLPFYRRKRGELGSRKT